MPRAFYGPWRRLGGTVALLAIALLSTAPAHAAESAGALQARLSADMHTAGAASGAYVYDLSAHRALASIRATTGRPPASVEKLYTAWAALSMLGPSATLTTTVLGTGSLGPDGTYVGDLYLHGGGDPALGPAGLATLASQLTAAGIVTVQGRLLGDESYFDPLRGEPASHYAPDPDLEGTLSALAYDRGQSGSARGPHAPAAWAAQRLAGALAAVGVEVTGGEGAGTAPPGASLLAGAPSPTVAGLLGLTLPPSDNFYAEMLLKGLGARFGGAGSTAAGAAVVQRVNAGLGLHPTVLDGSGLSRADRTSPREIALLLGDIAPTSLGGVLRGSLAVAGRTGTLAHRMRHTAAAGRCQAKTGTLVGTSNLAGYCLAAGGHTIVFALLMNAIPTGEAHRLQDDMTAAIAGFDDGTLPGALRPPAGGRLPTPSTAPAPTGGGAAARVR